ncbi:hypothetical protein DNTS_020414 [Danionella cerebrum]|uniref:Thiosulfate sulfurtransferase/rhodanese-like domain-containing protein 2 n=1 Tax=Danionella cerebrum TaxID=2873325 RepID=A0A553QMB4_9TELE|nr:hypothetical protein DNTS_020414 [Danionella translucida]
MMMEGDLVDLDVENLCEENNKDKREISSTRKVYSRSRRRIFAEFVASKKLPGSMLNSSECIWLCCGHRFTDPTSIHTHTSSQHSREIHTMTNESLKNHQTDSKELHQKNTDSLKLYSLDAYSPNLQEALSDSVNDSMTESESLGVNSWIPDLSGISELELVGGASEVLLFYCYQEIREPHIICMWQQKLCFLLRLRGKVRVASEGINGTVGGSKRATEIYIKAMMEHPSFRTMSTQDFKRSTGSAECFPDLRVGVFNEIVPMGINPEIISYTAAGQHLEPEEFHREVQTMIEEQNGDTVLLDCRNFYESKIGQFQQCLAPDIRKFSYFPEFVDQNLHLFRDKKVLMYCTGGIRCERGSAYLKSTSVCREVLQLKGGIHKYLEQFPDGFYRGKLFVFDQRYSLAFNQDVISVCVYCGRPWDQYQLCSSSLCSQLVLSCSPCRERGLTACCLICQQKNGLVHQPSQPQSDEEGRKMKREQCQCTNNRDRIPQHTSQSG